MDEKVLLDSQREFARMLPEIKAFANFRFAFMDPDARDEAVQETTALAWMNYASARSKGKVLNASTLVHYAALNVTSGRRMAGSSSTDVMSRETQMKGRATVENFGKAPVKDDDQGESGENDDGTWGRVHDAMVGRRQWERPLEHVRINMDYRAFLEQPGVNENEKSVFEHLSAGSTTSEMAQKIGVSSPRVCQLKNSLGKKLREFFGPGMCSPLVRRPELGTSPA